MTGVQTCALPIWAPGAYQPSGWPGPELASGAVAANRLGPSSGRCTRGLPPAPGAARPAAVSVGAGHRVCPGWGWRPRTWGRCGLGSAVRPWVRCPLPRLPGGAGVEETAVFWALGTPRSCPGRSREGGWSAPQGDLLTLVVCGATCWPPANPERWSSFKRRLRNKIGRASCRERVSSPV